MTSSTGSFERDPRSTYRTAIALTLFQKSARLKTVLHGDIARLDREAQLFATRHQHRTERLKDDLTTIQAVTVGLDHLQIPLTRFATPPATYGCNRPISKEGRSTASGSVSSSSEWISSKKCTNSTTARVRQHSERDAGPPRSDMARRTRSYTRLLSELYRR